MTDCINGGGGASGNVGCLPEIVMLAIGCLCVMWSWAMFMHLCVKEKHNVQLPRVQILSLRICLVVPLFTIAAIASYVWPVASPVIGSAQALFEGYALLCFFKMVVYFVGSDEKVEALVAASDSTWPCFYSCQKRHTHSCFLAMRYAFLQFLLLRPLLELVAGIFDVDYESRYQQQQTASIDRSYLLFRLFSALGILSLVLTLVPLLRVFNIFFSVLKPLSPLRKVFFIKLFILAWVVQFNTVNFISTGVSLDVLSLRRRLVSFVVLVELATCSTFFTALFLTNAENTVELDGCRSLVLPKIKDFEEQTRLEIRNESSFSFILRVLNFITYVFDDNTSNAIIPTDFLPPKNENESSTVNHHGKAFEIENTSPHGSQYPSSSSHSPLQVGAGAEESPMTQELSTIRQDEGVDP